ncbi:hypothetical protein HanIR_Chr03g0142591 [Helianthus annuus]|nr:hypothetical protein HanIR_Chr03g0142591 [Helianthus annuus]
MACTTSPTLTSHIFKKASAITRKYTFGQRYFVFLTYKNTSMRTSSLDINILGLALICNVFTSKIHI